MLDLVDIAVNMDKDTTIVNNRAKEMGIQVIMTGTTLKESKLLMNSGEYYTCGIHPTRSNTIDHTSMDEMRELIKDGIGNKLVAIGEMGLDYDRLEFSSKEQQLDGFHKQLEVASEFNLPLFLHNRNTGDDFYNLLKKYNFNGVVHSFTDSIDEMRRLVDMGLYIGINGCSLKTEENIKVVKEIPLSHLLLETDSPWCSMKKTHAGYPYMESKPPELMAFDENQFYNYKYVFDKQFTVNKSKQTNGKCMVKNRNEPCQLVKILCAVAGIKSESVEKIAKITFDNSKRLFRLK